MEALILAAMPHYRATADEIAARPGTEWIQGRTVVVTGATSGIGIPTVLALAKTGCRLIFTARDPAKGEATLASAKAANVAAGRGGSVALMALDLSSFESIRRFAAEFAAHVGDTLDVLVHNAGVMACPFARSEDGEEQQHQVNFLSVVLLTELLKPSLLRSDKGRVVVVSSSAHKRLPATVSIVDSVRKYLALKTETDPERIAATYDKWLAYASAKSAVIMYCNQLTAEAVAASQPLRALSLHPGGIMTGLQVSLSQDEMRHLGWLDAEGKPMPLFKTVEQGASTTVWCALAPELAGVGGVYCENCAITPSTDVGAPSADPSADIMSRVRGTAPHVWVAADCAAVVEAARKHLGL